MSMNHGVQFLSPKRSKRADWLPFLAVKGSFGYRNCPVATFSVAKMLREGGLATIFGYKGVIWLQKTTSNANDATQMMQLK